MKKLFVFLMFGLFSAVTYAGTANLFRYDASLVDHALATVNVLDRYVTTHHVDATQLDLKDNFFLSNYDNESINLFEKGPDSLFGIPAFWWGFLLNWVGILLVYFLTEQDKDLTKEALIGCVVGALIYTGFYLVWGGCWAWWL